MKYEPRSLWDEAKAAMTVRDGFLYSLENMVKRYHQPAYREECDGDKYEPENHAFEANALNVAQIAFNNPRVVVKPGRPSEHDMVAKALQHGLNRWSEKTKLREPMQQVCLDTQFCYGAFMVTPGDVPGYKHEPSKPVPQWPVCDRLSQRQFFFDPLCKAFGRARYAGHECGYDKDELLELAQTRPDLGWNAQLIETAGTTKEFEDRDEDIRDAMPDRKEIKTYEMWCPGHDLPDSPGPDEGYHGTIFTLVDGQKFSGDEWVRAPRPAYVPRWGPYVLAGMYFVPDLVFPLAPLMAVEGQVREYNAHASAMAVAMAKYKKLVLVSSDRTDLIQKINSPNLLVIPVQGFRKDEVAEFEIGGVTEQHLAMREVMRQRLDRNSGISDAQRGSTQGGTATANAIADEASTTRMGYLKQRMGDAARQVFETAGDFLLKDDRVVFPLGEEASQELGMGEAWFYGGPVEGMDPVSMDDLDVTIEPYSMDQMGQGVIRQQFMESLQIMLGMVPMVRQYPEVHWKDLFNKLGDINNDSDWGNMVDSDMAAMMQGLPQGQPESQPPALAGTLPRDQRRGAMAQPDPSMTLPGAAGPKGQQSGGRAGKSAAKGRTLTSV